MSKPPPLPPPADELASAVDRIARRLHGYICQDSARWHPDAPIPLTTTPYDQLPHETQATLRRMIECVWRAMRLEGYVVRGPRLDSDPRMRGR